MRKEKNNTDDGSLHKITFIIMNKIWMRIID
jgi:hypothetical protein